MPHATRLTAFTNTTQQQDTSRREQDERPDILFQSVAALLKEAESRVEKEQEAHERDMRELTEMLEKKDIASSVCKEVKKRKTAFKKRGWTEKSCNEVKSEADSELKMVEGDLSKAKIRVRNRGFPRTTKASKAWASERGRVGLNDSEKSERVNSKVKPLYESRASSSIAAQSHASAGSAMGGTVKTEG